MDLRRPAPATLLSPNCRSVRHVANDLRYGLGVQEDDQGKHALRVTGTVEPLDQGREGNEGPSASREGGQPKPHDVADVGHRAGKGHARRQARVSESRPRKPRISSAGSRYRSSRSLASILRINALV